MLGVASEYRCRNLTGGPYRYISSPPECGVLLVSFVATRNNLELCLVAEVQMAFANFPMFNGSIHVQENEDGRPTTLNNAELMAEG